MATRASKEVPFESLMEQLDQTWIEQALEQTGTASIRTRRLPAEQVVWLVIGLALYRDETIAGIVDKLGLALPGERGLSMAPSSIPAARARLGPEPMKWLFETCARKWALESAGRHRWRGLQLFGIDGTTMRAPDSEENRAHFGGHSGGADRGQSGYPLVRAVTLMALRSHLLAGFRFGPCATSEQELARELWPLVPDDSVTIVDRAFLSPGFLLPYAASGSNRHWMTRAKKNTKWRVLRRLGRGDHLVEMETSFAALKADPTLPRQWLARAVRYQRPGFKPQTILTSLTDAATYPASELAGLYHERWELELGFDEMKTVMLEREEALRSKSPRGIAQELFGLVLSYNLVRVEMERTAALAGLPPNRISFIASVRCIKEFWFWANLTSLGSIPKRLRKMRLDLLRFILPPRRSERLFRREVKIKMSKFPRKRTAATHPGMALN